MVALAGPRGSPFARALAISCRHTLGIFYREWAASHRGRGLPHQAGPPPSMLLSHWLGAMMVITGTIHPIPSPYPLTHSVWTPDRPLGTVLPLLLFLLFLISSPSPSFHHLVSSCSCFKGAPSTFVPGIGVFG